METPLAPETRSPRASERWYFVAMLALLPLVIEGLLHLLSATLPPVEAVLTGSRRAAVPRYLEDPDLVYLPNPAHPDHDTQGFRNQEVPETVRVVALGDSQTYGAGVSRGDAWPKQLAELLGEPVYNISCGGHGPTQSLLLLDKALALAPEVVVEAVYAGNDLFDGFHLVHGLGGLPELRPEDAAVTEAIAEAEARESLLGQVQRVSGATSTGLKGWLREHSRLYGLARATRNALRGPVDPSDWSSLVAAAARTGGMDETFESAQGVRTTFTPRYRLCALDQEDVRIREGRRIALECLKRMARRVEEAGARFLVLLIPTKELVFRGAVEAEGLASPVFLEVTDNELVFWEELRRGLGEAGIEFVEALPDLRSRVDAGEAPYPMSNDGHPNPAGHGAIAGAVARALVVPE